MAKSDLHIELAQRALVWLEGRATNRGIRGCEEIRLASGYVADSVAISGLQYAHEKALLKDKKRNPGNNGNGIADDYAFVFESKVSRSDFLNTFKHCNHIGDRLKPVGNFHFVVCPYKMLAAADVPTFWGLLEQRGTGLGIVKMPEFIDIAELELYKISHLILRGSKSHKFTLYSDLITQYREQQANID